MYMTMKYISRFVIIFVILSVIFVYIIVHYFNSAQVGLSKEIVWADIASNRDRKERIVSGLRSNQDLLNVQNYGELGGHVRVYKNAVQRRLVLLLFEGGGGS
jgi:hypothetical protein